MATNSTTWTHIRRTDATEQFDPFFFICRSPKRALSAPFDVLIFTSGPAVS